MKNNNISLLGLSKKEILVLNALKRQQKTPLLISRVTNVTRPAVYEILKKLKQRGIVKSQIRKGKKFWIIRNKKEIEKNIYDVKKYLLDISDATEEVCDMNNEKNIIIYRGKKDIQKLIKNIILTSKGKRLFVVQGDTVKIGWDKFFGVKATNDINKMVKENKVIMEVILPVNWFEKHVISFGKEWAENFSGRMTVAREIDNNYFQHGGQLFIVENAIYLVSLNENIIIEIYNSEIQKMILAMFKFMRNNSRKIDPNKILRNFILKEKL